MHRTVRDIACSMHNRHHRRTMGQKPAFAGQNLYFSGAMPDHDHTGRIPRALEIFGQPKQISIPQCAAATAAKNR